MVLSRDTIVLDGKEKRTDSVESLMRGVGDCLLG